VTIGGADEDIGMALVVGLAILEDQLGIPAKHVERVVAVSTFSRHGLA
jgi:hypothetical protein